MPEAGEIWNEKSKSDVVVAIGIGQSISHLNEYVMLD